MLFFIILVLSLIAGFVLPWWAIAIISFLAALLAAKTTKHAFWSAFAAVFIVWVALAMFKSVPNNHILAARVANVFHLPHWIFILLITALIGGLVAGMSAVTGRLVKQAFFVPEKEYVNTEIDR